VPYGRTECLTINKQLQVPDYERNFWNCKLCKKRVNKKPTESNKAVEPVWWWWCDACRQHQTANTDLQQNASAAGMWQFVTKQ